MSSPLQPFLYLDENGKYRLYLSGYKPRQFIASDDSMYLQGGNFPAAMKKAGDPNATLTDEEAIDALKAAVKYYKP